MSGSVVSGFPMPLAMGGGGIPFVMSGTFASGMDGFTSSVFDTFGFGRLDATCIRSGGSGAADLTIPSAVAKNLSISMSIWCAKIAGSGTRDFSLQYRLGAGPFTTLDATSTATSELWELLSGSFENAGDEDITMRVTSNSNNCAYDDWEIVGS